MSTTDTDTREGTTRRLPAVDWRASVVYVGFVLTFLFFAVTQSQYFLTPTNLTNVVIQAAPIAIMAVGAVFVLSTGEIDLSIGSTVALASLGAALVLESTGNWLLGAAAGLAVGAAVGAVNGVFVTYVRLPSFLVTLASMGLVTGIARQLTDLQSVPVTDDAFVWIFGGGDLLGVPTIIWWTVVVTIVGAHLLRQRRFGAHVLAVGNNTPAARVSGVRVDRVRMWVFVLSGMTAAMAALLYSGRLQGARYTLGESDLLSVLAAVIVGGTALTGGKGSMVGALIGSLLISMINNGLILAGLNVSQQMIVRGIIILLAVSLSLRGKKQG
ncbi:ABC transporter permease [Klenkia taihuensis]|uniref:Monosaccharide ABC transporter membrane protein, CUT2 family (TC 3.A.1.2.-) n=1 Tax=Klenkia taihuensis TaxID=1225127 RepID=A0A1I1I4Z6_9ACTN|nr:ABC transporter permease [Klenkia taihuensis]GHE08973.1 ABC transporter permease [Klenkia taihuensis]SFC28270.1 monosaccharide ABC transporter membrane protein, CUT2 family (TC 3.A.1.2.-) [Klenkia taihuensis]